MREKCRRAAFSAAEASSFSKGAGSKQQRTKCHTKRCLRRTVHFGEAVHAKPVRPDDTFYQDFVCCAETAEHVTTVAAVVPTVEKPEGRLTVRLTAIRAVGVRNPAVMLAGDDIVLAEHNRCSPQRALRWAVAAAAATAAAAAAVPFGDAVRSGLRPPLESHLSAATRPARYVSSNGVRRHRRTVSRIIGYATGQWTPAASEVAAARRARE